MQILRSLDAFKADSARPLVLALGNFDGVHLGHQALLDQTLTSSNQIRGRSAVLTFSVHPQCVLRPELCPAILSSLPQKICFFESQKIDLGFLIDFTLEFSHLTAEAFIQKLLVDQLRVAEVCMGTNARFGQGRKGDAALMQKLSQEFGFRVKIVPPVVIEKEAVSSSRIRALLEQGRLPETAQCLGRNYSVLATVIRGEGRGKPLGFPTANLEVKEMLPKEGVYAVKVETIEFQDALHFKVLRAYHGVLNYGSRPTFGASSKVAEVHLLDFKGDLYNVPLRVSFLKRIREEKFFPSADALKRQIQADINTALLSFGDRSIQPFTLQ